MRVGFAGLELAWYTFAALTSGVEVQAGPGGGGGDATGKGDGGGDEATDGGGGGTSAH